MAKAKPISKSSSLQDQGTVSTKSAEKDTAQTEQASVPHLSEAIQVREPVPRIDSGHVSNMWDAAKTGLASFAECC